MIGKGKYDSLLTEALGGEATGFLVILTGPQGPGFSAQCTTDELSCLPRVLRQLADDMEADFRGHLAQ